MQSGRNARFRASAILRVYTLNGRLGEDSVCIIGVRNKGANESIIHPQIQNPMAQKEKPQMLRCTRRCIQVRYVVKDTCLNYEKHSSLG